jgi:hypothetical protein
MDAKADGAVEVVDLVCLLLRWMDDVQQGEAGGGARPHRPLLLSL